MDMQHEKPEGDSRMKTIPVSAETVQARIAGVEVGE